MASFYSWADTGSPGRNLTGNYQNRLRQILKACLVDGYGATPSAGWSMVHEHANGFSMTNGPGSGIVNFHSDLEDMDYAIHLHLAESATDTTGPVIQGANLRSGTFVAGEVDTGIRQSISAYFMLVGYLSTLQWTLVADERSFVLSMWAGTTTADGHYSITLYVGEVVNDLGLSSTASFIAAGGINYGKTLRGESRAFTNGLTTLRDQQTGLIGSALASGYPYSHDQAIKSSGLAGPLPAQLNLQQAKVWSVNGFTGKLRGVLYDDALFRYHWTVWQRALGLPATEAALGQRATVNLGTALEPDNLELSVAAQYFGSALLTTDARFWQ